MADVQVKCIIKPGNQQDHEHITHLGGGPGAWLWTREQVIESIDAKSNTFYVLDSRGNRANVGVVRPQGRPAYVRTYADGKWKDNLLALPSC